MKRAKIKATILTSKGNRKIDIPLSIKRPLLVDRVGERSSVESHVDADDHDVERLLHDDGGVCDLREREKRKITSGCRWDAIKVQLVSGTVSQFYLPSNTVCCCCKNCLAVVRCEDCGPRQYLCLDCCKTLHSSRNYFHIPEVWEGNTFIPILVNETPLKQDHQCAFKEVREIVCIDEHGSHHVKHIEFCQCEHPTVTLVKLALWPGSPERPKVAFHVKLMELIEMLFIQCQVPLHNISKLLENRKHPLLPRMVHSVYDILNSDAFEEYRQYKFSLSKLNGLCQLIKDGSVTCPLCPQSDGVHIESVDACFGLARKKCKGEGLGQPRHGTLFFADQDDVDNFVENYNSTSNNLNDKDCSKFHAGEVLTSLRSKGKNELFDEKGVFGRVCRHDFPKGFINVKHGERISYSVYETERILQNLHNKPGIKLVLMYDIACTLDTHLKANQHVIGPTENITFAIPVFHCYGHKVRCQVNYSPRRVEGLGLTDGEGVERLWSFLRQFSKITKEMAADKRVDVLTDALIYYSYSVAQNFGTLLKAKLLRAQSLQKNCIENLETLLKSLPVPCSEQTINTWINEELSLSKNAESEINFAWDEQYVELLLEIQQLRSSLESAVNDDLEGLWEANAAKLKKKQCSLSAFEKKHNLKKSWVESDRGFVAARSRLYEKQRALKLGKLHVLAAERTFLLGIKKKYADGQSIAIKLSKQISKVTNSINKVLISFDHLLGNQTVTFEMVKDPNAEIYQLLNCTSGQNDVPCPWSVRRQIIDWHNLKNRAKEEEALVAAEMVRLCDFYLKDLEEVTLACNSEELKDAGMCSMLYRKRLILSKTLSTLAATWDGLDVVQHTFSGLDTNCQFYKQLDNNVDMTHQQKDFVELEDQVDVRDWESLESWSEGSEDETV